MKIINRYIQEIGFTAAAAIGAGAYALYQRMLTDAAKACNSFAGAKKSVCMLNYKIRGAKIMASKARNKQEKMMWQSRLKKYQYKLVIAQKKLQQQN